MRSLAKIPATVITGFLGAGKTTLIRHLLRTAGGRRLALVINEFGDIGVDGEILRACEEEACHPGDIVELANGCLCCTVADDFLPTIETLLGREPPPDHIIIETSGLALPKPLVKAFSWPEVRTRVTVDGVITVIDGAATAAGLFAADPQAVADERAADPSIDHDDPLEELFVDQLQCADLVILNKTDLLDEAALADAMRHMAPHLRDGVKVLRTTHGGIDAGVLLGLAAAAEDDLATRPSVHDAEGEHDHDDFASFHVDLGHFPSPNALMQLLRPVLAAPEVLRLKGFAAIAGKPMRLAVQAVGQRLETYFDRPWTADERPATRLVVIGGRDMDEPAIRAALAGA
ncbi:MAG: cobalamin biosynthesis protein CobW [Rhodospirillaceae bacterium]|nr:cobalamin biosynthesis protein CobW [Rhodospirillaceae bacterium]